MRLFQPIFLIAILASGSRAQVHLDSGSNQMLRSPDIHFAMDAQQIGLGAIEYAKVAEQAGAPALKQTATDLADFYRGFNRDAEAAVLRDQMVLSQIISGKDLGNCNKLRRMSGGAFEKHWTKDVLKSQKRAVKLFKREIKKGKDERMRDLARQGLPILEQKLAAIKALHS